MGLNSLEEKKEEISISFNTLTTPIKVRGF